ncbi:nucleoside diphosphate kinase [Mycotypha africana]|uniref:nucleoside diphosphate kinase n=1 Tax=Mycotypha africana TaxID=64632 RepID=UPI0023004F01|nr:nucleoside diphosphate kinase [Mycotypha africana]KAI8982238.1 nucleoside diphosphate kinase [Mycotypha africana]
MNAVGQNVTHSTRSILHKRQQITLALLKPDICANPLLIDKVKEAIRKNNMEIVHEKRVLWTEKEAGQFYQEHQQKFFYHRLCGYMTSGPFQAMILTSPKTNNVIKEWRQLIGPTHPVKARIHKPNTLRALYGLTDTRNSFHGSDSDESAKSEIAFFFPELFTSSSTAS